QISYMTEDPRKEHLLLAIPSRERLVRGLRVMLDEEEFLSPFGIRSLSRFHSRSPFFTRVAGEEHRVAYEPAAARSALVGGNSNWRGPIWFPVIWLITEVLERYPYFPGDELQVECPTGSGRLMNLR